jgi:peroxiredoxin
MNPISKALLICSLLLPKMLYAQSERFVLKGAIRSLNPLAKAYLCLEVADKEVWDSTFINNGSFEFQGNVEHPVLAHLFITSGRRDLHEKRKLYIEKGTTTIDGRGTLKDAVISGAGALINKEFSDIVIVMDSLTRELDGVDVNDYVAREIMQNKFEERVNCFKVSFIRKYPDSYFSLKGLIELNNKDFLVPDTIATLYEKLSWELKESVQGKELKANIERRKQLTIGSYAPDFFQKDMHDSLVSLSDFRGKYVLLEFWASWCKPCREEAPYLTAAYRQHNNGDFTILSVSLDREGAKNQWLKAIAQDGTGMWTHVSELNAFSNTAAKQYMVTAIPANFLIDPSGKIIAKNLRGESLTSMLEYILKNSH